MRLIAVAVLTLSLLKGCELDNVKKLTSPEAVSSAYEEGLKPYFPNAHASAVPQQEAIVGFSCLHGEGKQFVQMVAANFGNIPQMQELKVFRQYGPLLGSKTYRYAFLVFETGSIRLDVDTWEVDVFDSNDAMRQAFAQVCGN